MQVPDLSTFIDKDGTFVRMSAGWTEGGRKAAQVRTCPFCPARTWTEQREWGPPSREFCQIGTGSSAPHNVFTLFSHPGRFPLDAVTES
jgi:hypothetical protein